MEKQILDYVLVPVGLAVMVAYHLWLLRQIIRRPATTVLGINSINRRMWVRAMMELFFFLLFWVEILGKFVRAFEQSDDAVSGYLHWDTSKNGVLAVQTLRNNIMASTLLASTAIMLSSVIAILMSGGTSGHRPIGEVYGDNSKLGFSIKFFSIMVCFLGAFLLNVQSIRYYSHASMLINVPSNIHRRSKMGSKDCVTTAEEYVWMTVNRGSYFWSLGLRAFYLSFPLFLWIFGPIPMFVCCVLMVFLLYFLDVTFHFGSVFSANSLHEEEDGLVNV